jgi:hypothetical protein
MADPKPLRVETTRQGLSYLRPWCVRGDVEDRPTGVLGCGLTFDRGCVMRRLAVLAVVAALMLPTAASGQYTFGDWARDRGYSPGDVMPGVVYAVRSFPPIDSLDASGTPRRRTPLLQSCVRGHCG